MKKDKLASNAHILMIGSAPGVVVFLCVTAFSPRRILCLVGKKRGQLEKGQCTTSLHRAGEELSLRTGDLGTAVSQGRGCSENGAGGKGRQIYRRAGSKLAIKKDLCLVPICFLF